MPRRPSPTRRWLTAFTWPGGIALTSWDYVWRTTVLHRREITEQDAEPHLPPAYPATIDDRELQPVEAGHGPLFHRRYRVLIRDSPLNPEQLMTALKDDVNDAAPTAFARFQRVLGDGDALGTGDEYVVRMPGPWDGPVRVIDETPRSFRLATLEGHLEAGQIEFRATDGGGDAPLGFEIESWARSSGRFSDMLYQHAHMSKEVQLHMWVSFLEGVVGISGGRVTGGIDIDTRRVQDGAAA
jgi:hypothetical protein